MAYVYDIDDGSKCSKTFWEPLIDATGAISTVGFRPVQNPAFVIFKEDGVYYARNGLTGKLDYNNSDAHTVIQAALNAVKSTTLDVAGKVVFVKDEVELDTAITYGSVWNDIYPQLLFNSIKVTSDVPAFEISNLRWGGAITGNFIRVYPESFNNTHSLVNVTGKVSHFRFTVNQSIRGSWDNGNTMGLEVELGAGDYLTNSIFTIRNWYAVRRVLYVNMTSTSWASVNQFHLGLFENVSPEQIYISKSGSDSFHQNVITGCGGAQNVWDPLGLGAYYTIKLATADTGKILGTTFRDFYVYSAVDEIYRADSGVIGTKFIGGMPRIDLRTYWHDTGVGTEFISCFLPNVYSYTRVNPVIATFANDDLTPSVANRDIWKTATGHGAPKDITMFDDGYNGQIITIISSNPANATTIKDGGNLLINGDWVDGAEKTLKLVFDGTNWYEISRR